MLINYILILSVEYLDLRLKEADSLFFSQHFLKAESLYNEVLINAKGIERGVCLKGLGNIYFSFGDIEKSKKFYNEALKIFKSEKYYPGITKIYINLGSLSFYQNNIYEAKDFFNQALKMNQKIKEKSIEDKIDEINVYLMLGNIYITEDNFEEGKKTLYSVIQNSEKIGYKKGIIDGSYLIGSIFIKKGEPDSAMKYFGLSCSLSLNLGLYKSAADAYREMGNILRKLGDYDLSYEYLNNALIYIRKLKGERGILIGEGEILINIGNLLVDMGKYHAGIENFKNAYEIFKYTKNETWEIEALFSIGYSYILLAPAKSIYLDTAIYYFNLSRQIIMDKKDEGLFFNNLGIAYERKGEFDKAIENYEKSLDIYKLTMDSVGITKVLCNLGNLYVIKGDYKKGIDYYKEAIKIAEKSKRKDWELSILSNLGFAFYKSGETDEAINSLKMAVDMVENLRGKLTGQEFKSAFFENKIFIYEMLIELYFKKGDAKNSFYYAENAKSRAFLDLLRGIDISEREDLSIEIKELIKKEQELERKIEFLTGLPEQTSAIIEHNKIIKELSKKFPDYNILKSKKPIDVKEVQKILDDKTAIIEYFVGFENAYVFGITSNKLCIRKIDAKPNEIYQKIKDYRDFIRMPSSFDDNDFLDLSKWFFNKLIKPVWDEIKDKKRLCIIPYGSLHNLPFSTIVIDPETKKLIIDNFDIFYAPSSSVYLIARNKNKLKKESFVIFAKSKFREHPAWFDMPLNGTIGEKDSILKIGLTKNIKIFSDDSLSNSFPTETNVKKNVKDFDIVHFATHGKLAPGDSAMESRIILSKDEENDGELKVKEIFNLELNAYLITLSACETGQLRGFSESGFIGDELTGLSRAFIYAGTPSVVASLWKVSDDATVLLMMNFYKNLKSKDKTKALCDAQRWLKKQEFYDKPFYWAPFAVFGDWR